MRGEPAQQLGVAIDVDDRRMFVRQNTETYWRTVGEQAAGALTDPGRVEFPADVIEWSVLGVLRGCSPPTAPPT